MTIRRCKLCPRTARTHTISREGVCKTCDVALIYWNKRTTSQKMRRAMALDSFQARMSISLGNIRTMPRRASKRRRVAHG